MGIGINEFIGNMTGGGLRPSLFRVTITAPAFANQKASYLCKNAILPPSEMGKVEASYMGRKVNFAGDRVFNDITLSFYEDSDVTIRKDFEAWSALMNKHEANTGANNPREYYGDLTIEALDRQGAVVYTYEVKDAIPTTIGEVSLGYENNDEIATFDVTFAINYWESAGSA